MIRKILGVDPGLASATAAIFGYDGRKNYPEILGMFDIPTKGEGTTKRIDVTAFFRWLGEMDPDIAYVEAANTMPALPDKFGHRRGMGVASAGRYMRAAGALEATVELCGINIVMVQPVSWKRALGLIGEKKASSLSLVRDLYPNVADQWFKRKKDHNRAEAVCLAIFGAMRCDLVSLRIAA